MQYTTECTEVQEIDINGNIIWRKRLEWIDSAPKSMLIDNGIIYLSGNHPSGEQWLWHHMSVEM